MRLFDLACLALVGTACVDAAEPFRCDSDIQCVDQARTGHCEPAGFCSFPDPTCASFRRFAARAAAAGQCVTAANIVAGGARDPLSCLDLHQRAPEAPDGITLLDPDGPGGQPAFSAHCDMTSDGGGWTLALKADGNKATFTYEAALWTDSTVLAPDNAALDRSEAKLATFSSVPFSELRVGLSITPGDLGRWLRVPIAAPSLLSLFAPGTLVPTTMGRAAWLSLIPDAALQDQCSREGINVAASARIRIGMTANNEDNCESTDSWLGIGGVTMDRALCPSPNVTRATTGNALACGPPFRDVAAFGYVLVR